MAATCQSVNPKPALQVAGETTNTTLEMPQRTEWVRAAALAALDHRNRGLPRDLRTQLPRNGPPCLRSFPGTCRKR